MFAFGGVSHKFSESWKLSDRKLQEVLPPLQLRPPALLLSALSRFGAASCPDERGLSMPTSTLSDTCNSDNPIFTDANLQGAADVLTVYTGDLT